MIIKTTPYFDFIADIISVIKTPRLALSHCAFFIQDVFKASLDVIQDSLCLNRMMADGNILQVAFPPASAVQNISAAESALTENQLCFDLALDSGENANPLMFYLDWNSKRAQIAKLECTLLHEVPWSPTGIGEPNDVNSLVGKMITTSVRSPDPDEGRIYFAKSYFKAMF